MMLPNFAAERSLYRNCRNYRASELTRVVGGVRPSYQPGGSYLQSCFNCTYTPGIFGDDDLACSCYDESGNAQQTDLQFTLYCQGDIYNNNGVLGCDYTGTG